MDDLRSANVDFMTIGQYLAPSKKHQSRPRVRHAGRLSRICDRRYSKGFLMVGFLAASRGPRTTPAMILRG